MRTDDRLINIDNGGTLTDFCLVDGGEVRYTKTLTTPNDLSRRLFDGLAKVSELAYGEPRLAALLQSTDCIRYSTTQGTNPRSRLGARTRARQTRLRSGVMSGLTVVADVHTLAVGGVGPVRQAWVDPSQPVLRRV
jgi:hypothetical protein